MKVNSIGFIMAVILPLFFYSCSDAETGEDNYSEDGNLYSLTVTPVQNSISSECVTIEDIYKSYLHEEELELFFRNGSIEQCDKDVILGCKDAEISLSNSQFKGTYSVEVNRLSQNGKDLIYSTRLITQDNTQKVRQFLVWEQGRYTTTGGKASSDNVIRTANPVIVSKGEKYLFEAADNTTILGFYYDKNGMLISPCITINNVITIPSGAMYMHLSYRSKNKIGIKFADTFNMYQEVEMNGMNSYPSAEALLTIIDDDSHIRYFTDIYPMAKQKKVSISSAVIVGQIDGRTSRMTWENINEAYCNGMEMLCHTFTHPLTTDAGWNSYTDIYFEEDYRKAKNTLKAHGIDANLLVFSGSSARYQMCQDACKRASFDGAFLAGDNKITFGDCDRFKIPRYRVGNDSDYHYDLPLLQGLVNKLISSGGWMVWMIHTSSSKGWVSGNSEGSSAYIIGQIIDYARANNIHIVTAEYGFRKYFLNK